MVDTLTPFEALKRAHELIGSYAEMARICGVSHTAVQKWLQSSKRLPAEYVLRVEAATGVSRHALRPDIYPAPVPAFDHGPTVSRTMAAGQCNRRPKLDKRTAA